MELLNNIINILLMLSPVLIYFFLFGSTFIENIFPFIPGDIIITIGGWLIAQHIINFPATFLIITISSIIGFIFLFWIGSKYGRTIFEQKKILYISKNNLIQFEQLYNKFGYTLILFNRFLPGMRLVIPVCSGISRLNFYKVIIYSSISAAVWNGLLIYLVAYIIKNWMIFLTYIKIYSRIMGSIVVSVFIIIFIIVLYKRRNK